MKKTVIYALTPEGSRLGKRLADKVGADLFLPNRLAPSFEATPFDHFMTTVGRNFSLYPQQVFIAATGIVVRSIASHLKSKNQDPAIIVLDQKGRYVISLISGHLGGANDLAREVARLTGGEAVITTATDTARIPAIDLLAKVKDLTIANLEAVKSINMAFLTRESVQIFDPEDRLGLKNQNIYGSSLKWVEKEEKWTRGKPGVWVTWKIKDPEPHQMVLHPKCLIAGVGCNRETESREILNLITSTFKRNILALESLKCLTSMEAKRNERGLEETARSLGVPLYFFDAEELRPVKVSKPSNVVRKYMGVSSVCEATALLKARGGRLLVPKTKSRNVTLAVALEK